MRGPTLYLRMTRLLAACVALFSLSLGASAHAAGALLVYDTQAAPLVFAARDLDGALQARGLRAEHLASDASHPAPSGLRVRFFSREEALRHDAGLAAQLGALRAEGFALLDRSSGGAREWWVVGADVAGQMYGGLELAEQVRVGGVAGLKPLTRSPHMPLRGVKFNIP